MGVVQHSHHWGTILYGLWPSRTDPWWLTPATNIPRSRPLFAAHLLMWLCVYNLCWNKIFNLEMHIYIYYIYILNRCPSILCKKTKIYIRVVSWVWCRIHVSACNYAIYAYIMISYEYLCIFDCVLTPMIINSLCRAVQHYDLWLCVRSMNINRLGVLVFSPIIMVNLW